MIDIEKIELNKEYEFSNMDKVKKFINLYQLSTIKEELKGLGSSFYVVYSITFSL